MDEQVPVEDVDPPEEEDPLDVDRACSRCNCGMKVESLISNLYNLAQNKTCDILSNLLQNYIFLKVEILVTLMDNFLEENFM